MTNEPAAPRTRAARMADEFAREYPLVEARHQKMAAMRGALILALVEHEHVSIAAAGRWLGIEPVNSYKLARDERAARARGEGTTL